MSGMENSSLSVKRPLVCVAGPTASGKTALGINIARSFNGEIISADSMQIYKGMEIATAAPSAEERALARHHLVCFLDRSVKYSVADFCADASSAAEDIRSRGKIPVLVGGTGLYIDSFVNNIDFVSEETDLALRERLTERLEAVGSEKMLEELREIDPRAAERLHANDAKRIIRALEVYYLSGRTFSEQLDLSVRNESPYETLMLCLFFRDRQTLYDRINERVTKMAENGLVAEARRCLEEGGKTSVQAIGHKELSEYFSGSCSLEEALDRLRQQTRRYAKRQLTWFRRESGMIPLYVDDYDTPEELFSAADGYVKDFLNGFEVTGGEGETAGQNGARRSDI